ncbi:hypothetical protein EQ831_17020 [Pseudomonas sp. ALS1279]|nr:hypothetical protein EQ831_17020 [Pseudomonas sp. ALS1279]
MSDVEIWCAQKTELPRFLRRNAEIKRFLSCRYPPGAQRHAFELGFLSRIHQRLCSPLGGGHQALRTELRL